MYVRLLCCVDALNEYLSVDVLRILRSIRARYMKQLAHPLS